MLRGLLAVRLQLLHVFLQGADLGGESLVLLAQVGDHLRLFAGAGILQRIQLRLGLVQFLLRGLHIRPRASRSWLARQSKNSVTSISARQTQANQRLAFIIAAVVALLSRAVNQK